jgi:peptidoglycan/xylan/chitin deacetylase (PgdA/CDA1 family)
MIAANFSMDFELGWGDLRRVTHDDAFYARVVGGRILTERVLSLLERYSIPSVWGIVGACCASNLDSLRNAAPAAYQCVAADLEDLRRIRPGYAEVLFCPDLVRRIASSPLVEIGSHGFLHLYPLGLDPEVLRSDVQASVEALRSATGRNAVSFIPPQNFEWPEAAFEGSGIRFIRHTPSVLGFAYSDARAPAKLSRLWNDFVLPTSQRGSDGRDAKLLFLRLDRGDALWRAQKMLMRRLLASGRRTIFFYSHPHNLDTPALLQRFEEFCEIIATARERDGLAFAPFAKEVGGGRLATDRA